MNDRIRVAVVGTGDGGARARPSLLAAGRCRAVAIVGRSHAKAVQRAREFATTPYVDLDAMLEAERPDLVSVCLPNEDHFDTTLRGDRSRLSRCWWRSRWCSTSARPTISWTAAAERDLFFAINFNHRYAEPVQMAPGGHRRRRRSGRLDVRHLALRRRGRHQHAPVRQPHRDPVPRLRHARAPVRPDPVCQRPDERPDRTRTAPRSRSRSTFATGAVGTMLGSYDSSYAYPRHASYVEVNGTAGRVHVDDTVKRFTRSSPATRPREVWEAGYFNDPDRDFHRHLRAAPRRADPGAARRRRASNPRPGRTPGARPRHGVHPFVRGVASGATRRSCARLTGGHVVGLSSTSP